MRAWLKNFGFTVIGGILVLAVQGIIQNRADSAFLFLTSWISHSVNEDAVPWIISGIIAACLSGGAIYFWQHDKVLKQVIKRANKMIALDGSLLRALASWIPSSNRTDEIRRILREILRDATTEFDGHVYRAAVLTPDKTGEHLTCWAHFQMPQESIEDMEFYIGSDIRKRETEGGVAGEVFLTEKLTVGHMIMINGQWICKEHQNYKRSHAKRPYPLYKSFVNVPILGIDPSTRNATKCFGVVCFDSQNEKVFDSEEIKEVLLTLAGRLAAAVLVCEKLP